MLHSEIQTATPNSAATSIIIESSKFGKRSARALNSLIEVAFSAVEMDGRNLWREPDDVAVGQLAEALRLADLRGKSELNIQNITPEIKVGHPDSVMVPIMQKKIQQKIALACRKINRPVPDCRLDLSHGSYGIRCYLGRNKPTDHVFQEDFISDSR